jgi:hypothetical protein
MLAGQRRLPRPLLTIVHAVAPTRPSRRFPLEKTGAIGLLSIGVAWLLLGLVAVAGAASGTVTGLVKDALGRPLGGATVRLETSDGRTPRRTSTDEQGRFIFAEVPPGTYALVAERGGFETATAIGTVTEAEGWSVDLTLASRQPLDVSVATKRLDDPRIATPPSVGSSTYEITSKAIQTQPGGANNPLTQVLL